MIVVGEPGKLRHAARHVHADDRRRAARAGADQPVAPGRRERPARSRTPSAATSATDDDRPRPAAPPRPDRGDPRGGRPDQADPGRQRHRGDLGRDPRHERPPGDRDRRHPPGGADRRRAPLPRRRGAGAALADLAARDRSSARTRDRGRRAGVHDRDLAPRRGDRRRDRRLERRPPARRALPRRQRAHALAGHVHPVQLGALRRRDPLLRPRAARGSSSATGGVSVAALVAAW